MCNTEQCSHRSTVVAMLPANSTVRSACVVVSSACWFTPTQACALLNTAHAERWASLLPTAQRDLQVMYFTPVILEIAGFRDKQQILLLSCLPASVNAIGTVVGALFLTATCVSLPANTHCIGQNA
jgi:hypothetical protein